MGGQTRSREKQIESENRTRSAFQFSRRSLSVRPLAGSSLASSFPSILQWLFVERGGNYGRKTEKRMDRACETNEERRRKGWIVCEKDKYIYIYRERERERDGDWKIEQALPRQSNHRERKASRSGNVPMWTK